MRVCFPTNRVGKRIKSFLILPTYYNKDNNMKFLVIEKTNLDKYYVVGDGIAFDSYADAERIKDANESICKSRERKNTYKIVGISEEDNLEVVDKANYPTTKT